MLIWDICEGLVIKNTHPLPHGAALILADLKKYMFDWS